MKTKSAFLLLLIMAFTSCGEAKRENKFVGTWRSMHKAGGNTLRVGPRKLTYIARNCTGPPRKYENIPYTASGNTITFKPPQPYDHEFKLILTPHKGNLYLLSESQIEEIEKDKNEYWYTRAFKKQEEKASDKTDGVE